MLTPIKTLIVTKTLKIMIAPKLPLWTNESKNLKKCWNKPSHKRRMTPQKRQHPSHTSNSWWWDWSKAKQNQSAILRTMSKSETSSTKLWQVRAIHRYLSPTRVVLLAQTARKWLQENLLVHRHPSTWRIVATLHRILHLNIYKDLAMDSRKNQTTSTN